MSRELKLWKRIAENAHKVPGFTIEERGYGFELRFDWMKPEGCFQIYRQLHGRDHRFRAHLVVDAIEAAGFGKANRNGKEWWFSPAVGNQFANRLAIGQLAQTETESILTMLALTLEALP